MGRVFFMEKNNTLDFGGEKIPEKESNQTCITRKL